MPPSSSFLLRPLVGAAVLGGVGFACGFFGPIALNPEANQGPLLGIFITGPLGVVVGGALGLLCAALRVSGRGFIRTLTTVAVVGGAVTLFSALPEDLPLGFMIDAEVVACDSPEARLVEARAYWENALASYPRNRQREGWREDMAAMVARDPGVVVTLEVRRRWDVREQRKAWNRGTLVVRDRGARGREHYFARAVAGEDACASYVTGSRARYAPEWEYASVQPPDALPTFLSLHVLQAVPERYRSLLP